MYKRASFFAPLGAKQTGARWRFAHRSPFKAEKYYVPTAHNTLFNAVATNI